MEPPKNESKTMKKKLERKPSLKIKTLPPIRQTLTSYKRMLNANPLLKYQAAGIDINPLIAQRSLGNITKANLPTIDSKNSAPLNVKPSNDFKKPQAKHLIRTELPKTSGTDLGIKKSITNRPLTSNFNKSKLEIQPKSLPKDKIENKKPGIIEIKAKVNSFPKGAPKSKPTNPKIHDNPPCKGKSSSLRRSLSSGHLQTKKGHPFDPKQAYTKLQTQSQEQLYIPMSVDFKQCSPIVETSGNSRNFVFKTPSAYDRRSVCRHTPHSSRRSLLFTTSTPAPIEMLRLEKRLNEWLKSRGKPLASFHHLRAFESNEIKKISPTSVLNKIADPNIDEENKENIEVLENKTESYEDLKITPPPELSTENNKMENSEGHVEINQMSEEELSKHAKEAMVELLKLIEEDYPTKHCLDWLELIRNKYRKIDDEPEYWECRAALEQSAGNVQNAVEFYKKAIIQGAEVNTVDKSLDNLLKKFSLLNISTSNAEEKNHGQGEKERIVKEARNVFKSNIIQFAIRERNTKKNKDVSLIPTPRLVVTPVRRSTRLSRSAYTNTPGVTLRVSLRDIDLSTGEIGFEKNKALC